ncbi:MAG TPA: hypothetical protein PLA43_02765 [Bryobacteraceae bacterium]|nr:hypothetical protein [Bryobacteraceae bacterium]HOQ44533.1 hypothetical protein [Bryobacteraceae bacterium]HPQ13605.1 hypothetical protein [Bryobacteraceae bacterium]HPU70852.1 hypothetical protein [Bryobacteraceae bacterium]
MNRANITHAGRIAENLSIILSCINSAGLPGDPLAAPASDIISRTIYGSPLIAMSTRPLRL